MAYSVSSWFQSKAASKTLLPTEIVRRFYVGSYDLSDRVVKWPTISRSWNDIRAQTLNIDLAAGDVVLGDELLLNTGFDNSSYWNSVTSGFSISSGMLKISSTTTDMDHTSNGIYSAPPGAYRASFDVVSYVQGIVSLRFSGTGVADVPGYAQVSGTGHYEFRFCANSRASAAQQLVIDANSFFTGAVDNVSFRRELTLEWLINSALSIRKPVRLQWGFLTDSGTEELVTLFAGKLQSAQLRNNLYSLTIANKMRQLTERVIGTPNSPVNLVSSNYLISDLAWYVVTSHAGFSTVASTSNPDIDYASFLSWAGVFSSDVVVGQASLGGKKCSEVLRVIGELTESAIYEEGEKIAFRRFSLADSYSTSIDQQTLLNSDIRITDEDMVNRSKVAAGYNVNSDAFAITVTDQASSSVNSYGLREEVYDDTLVWFVNSISALNKAQRVTGILSSPQKKVKVKTTMHGFLRQVGEMINYEDGIVSGAFRVMDYSLDMDDGTITFGIENSQIKDAFTLDVSALDSSDVLI